VAVLTPNFADPNNWEIVGEKQWTRVMNSDGFTLGEIGEVIFPFVLERPTLAAAVRCIEPDPPETWNYGGRVIFKTQTGITNGAISDGVVGTKALYLNQINLIFLPNYGNNFTCGFFPPKWFGKVELTLWEYIGEGIPSNTTKLDYIGVQVDAIRAAVENPS
jgi:hypothetical protein